MVMTMPSMIIPITVVAIVMSPIVRTIVSVVTRIAVIIVAAVVIVRIISRVIIPRRAYPDPNMDTGLCRLRNESDQSQGDQWEQ